MFGSCLRFGVSLQLQGYAALVRRGKCDFTTKARMAQKAGAVAILIVNYKQGYFIYPFLCICSSRLSFHVIL